MKWTVRILRSVVFMLLLQLLCIPAVSAEAGETYDFESQYETLLEQSGANELFSLLPEEGQTILSENGMEGIDQDALLNLNFFDFLQVLWSSVKQSWTAPFSLFATCMGVILLCALLNSLRSSFQESSTGRVFSVVAVIGMASAVILPISRRITESAAVIQDMSKFLLSFVPVYTGIVTASGKPVSATAYNACLVGIAQVIAQLAATVLVPLLGIYLALCLIGSASHEIKVEGITQTVKKAVILSLSFLLTIFVGLLSIQGSVAAAADSVALKTVKFAAGAFLPVVGGAISEAMNTLQGCMGVIRSCVGGFGILAIAASILPPILSILLMQLSLWLSAGVADTLEVTPLSSLLRSASSVLSLLFGILLVFAMLFIVSLSMMLALTSG